MHFQATFAFVVLLAVAYRQVAAAGCQNPQVSTDVFATTDLVANSTVIISVDVRCAKAIEKEFAVYGVLESSRAVLVGARVEEAAGANSYRFQISLIDTEDLLKSGANTLRIYDEHSYAAYRKAVRESQDTDAISPLATVAVQKPSRPSRIACVISCEHCALLAGVVSIYLLYTLKSKLTN